MDDIPPDHRFRWQVATIYSIDLEPVLDPPSGYIAAGQWYPYQTVAVGGGTYAVSWRRPLAFVGEQK